MLDVVFERVFGVFHENPETVLGGTPVLLDLERVVQLVDGVFGFVENLLLQRVDLVEHCLLAVGEFLDADDLLGGVETLIEEVLSQKGVVELGLSGVLGLQVGLPFEYVVLIHYNIPRTSLFSPN